MKFNRCSLNSYQILKGKQMNQKVKEKKMKKIIIISAIFMIGQSTWSKNANLAGTERKKMEFEIKKIEKRVNVINKEIEQYKENETKLNELEARLNALEPNPSQTITPLTENSTLNTKLEKTELSATHMNEKVEYYKSILEGMKNEETEIKQMKQDIKDLKSNELLLEVKK